MSTQSGKVVLEGGISVNGRCPTNTDGGNMGRCHSSWGGSNSSIMCHDIVMTFALPPWAVVNSTTGPGSIN
jgi:hypothetical protein